MKAVIIYSISTILGAGGVLAMGRWQGPPAPAVASYYSQSGRDAALMALIKSANKTVYVRSASLDCAPIANELLQKQQNGVAVHLELPLRGSTNTEVVINALAQKGGTFELSGEPVLAYEGTYVLVDGHEWLYSAAPLSYGAPGAPRSYVRGRKS